jgi:hypothetical protein
MTDKVVAVIGAGVMGSDVAIDLSAHGFIVILKDLTDKRLDLARVHLERRYRLVKMVRKDWATQSLDELLARIRFVTDYDGIEAAGIVIENITENYEARRIDWCQYELHFDHKDRRSHAIASSRDRNALPKSRASQDTGRGDQESPHLGRNDRQDQAVS